MVFCRHLSCVNLAKSILPIYWNKSFSSNIKFLRSLTNISEQGGGVLKSSRQDCPRILLDTLCFWVLPFKRKQLLWFFCNRDAEKSHLSSPKLRTSYFLPEEFWPVWIMLGFPGWSVVKNPPTNTRDMGLIPGSGRSPREGNGNPLQSSCLGNLMYKGAWWSAVNGLQRSWR